MCRSQPLVYTKVKEAPTREERERQEILSAACARWGSEYRGKVELLEAALKEHSQQQGPWHDRWTPYPWGSKGEVDKRFPHQTSRLKWLSAPSSGPA